MAELLQQLGEWSRFIRHDEIYSPVVPAGCCNFPASIGFCQKQFL